MKKPLLFALAFVIALPALADLDANGYYRVQNAFTKRYALLKDDKGSVDVGSTSADVAALELYAGSMATLSDPSSVFYVSKAPTGNNRYDIAGQGTSVHSFMNVYIDILPVRKPYDGQNCYYIYYTDSGVTRYLGDIWDDLNDSKGMASVNAVGDDRKWYFDPIDADSDQYFGIAPTVNTQGKYYYPLYAAFPFSACSSGMKFYTITEIDKRGAVIYKEITGTVPASTPVIVECSYPDVWDNKLNLGGTPEAGAASGNLLKGVYFNNPLPLHYNRVAYDRETMRVLGSIDGRLAFVESDIDFLPANQAYLLLDNPDQYPMPYFLFMTEEERDERFGPEMSVDSIPVSSSVDVYSLDGRLVKEGILKEDVPSLGKGLYILRSGGVSEKLVVR